MKAQQLKDRKDIVRNREDIEKEILELKKENENLKAMVVGKNNDQHLKDAERVKDDNTSVIAFTQAPFPTQNPRKPAFSAKLSAYDHQLTDSETIKFDVVMTNIGGHYSSATGQFIAPTDGTYFFLATTFSCYNQYMKTFLYRNGEYLLSMQADGDDGHETGSIGIVLELSQGDYVYIIHNGDNGNCIYGEFSNFSGFQI
ncbi:cerebellin-1-like [Ruditapes philippinarum]|uniref:cerebellin-1-like n=1 Tax=Ruditapes philippinarum TaxID=129788 RepID=UPI00295B4DCB|nr:cerebellin-1-like [Ruditapes philippinarum]